MFGVKAVGCSRCLVQKAVGVKGVWCKRRLVQKVSGVKYRVACVRFVFWVSRLTLFLSQKWNSLLGFASKVIRF